MASLGSYIRSAAQATFSAYRSVPIRWRLAGGSAALTFAILAGFAAIVGVLTTHQVRGQFNDEVRSGMDQLSSRLNLKWIESGVLNCNKKIRLSDYASAEHAQIRVFDSSDGSLLCTQSSIKEAREPKGTKTTLTPSLFSVFPAYWPWLDSTRPMAAISCQVRLQLLSAALMTVSARW